MPPARHPSFSFILAIFLLFGVTLMAHAGAADTLSLAGAPPSSAKVGGKYWFKPTVAGAKTRHLHFNIANRPAWASFSRRSGALVGRPRASGTWSSIVISASDGVHHAQLKPFTIKVNGEASNGLSISGTPATTATVGQAYSFQPAVEAPAGAILNFTIINRPSWASFDPARGVLTGTPTAAGTNANIIITVHNDADSAALAAFTITVKETSTGNHAPTMSGTPSSTATVGSAYAFQPSASDSDGDKLSFKITNAPAWATFDATTGRLSGTPASSSVGTFSGIVIQATDGSLSASLPAFSITVSTTPTTPVVVNGAPRVLYSDLVAGPTSGGENDLGAYVSIFGKNFGSNLSQVHVYFGNVEAAAYRYLGVSKGRSDIQQITVQPGNVGTGSLPIKVVVNGVASNTDNKFLVNPGDVLFVDNVNGEDSSAVKNDINHPWRYVQTSSQGGALRSAQPGDVIVLRGKAVWKDVGFENRWFRFRSSTGTAPTGSKGSGYITIEAYPNEDVHYVAPANTNGGIHGIGDNYPQFSDWVVISGLHIESVASSASDGAPVNLQVKSDHWRVVNNELGPWPASSGAKAGGLVGNGTDVKALGNHIHDIGGGTENHCVYLDTGATNVEVAYSHIHHCSGGNIIQTYDNLGGGPLSGISIHHNRMHDGGRYGLNMSDGTMGVRAWNNLIYSTVYAGIRINQNGSGLSQVYENNTLFNVCTNHPAEPGAIQNTWNANNGSIVFRNNIVAKSQSACAQGYSDSSSDNAITLSRNLWSGYAAPSKDSQALSGDAGFVNAAGGDFHLQDGSTAVDASVGSGVADDFDVDSRSQADLGALEH